MNSYLNSIIRRSPLLLGLCLSVLTGFSQGPDIASIDLDIELETLFYDASSTSIWIKAKEGIFHYDGKKITLSEEVDNISACYLGGETGLIYEYRDSIIINNIGIDKKSIPGSKPYKIFASDDNVALISTTGIWRYENNQWDTIAVKSGYESGKIIDGTYLRDDFYYAIGNAIIQEEKVVVLPHKIIELYTAEINKGKQKLLALTAQNQLYIIDQGKAKKLVLPDVGVLDKVLKVYTKNHKSYFLTADKVYLFDAKEYSTTTFSMQGYIQDPKEICVDRWHNIWLANDHNLLRYHPNNVTQFPYVSLAHLSSSSKQVDKGETLEIDNHQELLTLPIEIISFQDNSYQLLYKWDNESWNEVSSYDQFYIHPIPKGKHELYIALSIEDHSPKILGQYSIKPKHISNHNWIWYLVAGLSVIIFLLIRSLYNYQSILKENQLLAERNAIRQESKAYQKEVLKLQMNPHFLYNSLNSISGLIANGESSRARKSISYFSKMMRLVLDQSREQQISIEEELSFIKSYFELEKLNAKYPFEYSIIVEATLDQEELIPTMIIQPFVENAIVHGISKIERGKIELKITGENDYIKVSVEDNGIGRAATKNEHKSHRSAAMEIVKERLAINAFKKGRYNIQDKIEGGSPKGTKVIIFIPKI